MGLKRCAGRPHGVVRLFACRCCSWDIEGSYPAGVQQLEQGFPGHSRLCVLCVLRHVQAGAGTGAGAQQLALITPNSCQPACMAAVTPMHPMQGRATLEMKVKCSETPEGPQTVTLVLVVDGYNAPVSAGQFVDLVQHKFYDGMEIQRADGFVVQTGDPDGPDEGYVVDGKVRR